MARRVSPVQAHYLGYMASTGVRAVDYWIGDEIITPPTLEWQFSERLWRLPRTWMAYRPKADLPRQAWEPDPQGRVRFASFNSVNKLTPATLTLWARVLQAVPNGTLSLKQKAFACPDVRARIADAIEAHGIDGTRLCFVDANTTPSWAEHMQSYATVDIALDPVGGVSGGTTTCDALAMGVPVVTLLGDRTASRMSASFLSAAGHPEWIAVDETAYVALARDLATRVNTLGAARADLRAAVEASPLMDSADLARALETAFSEMVERSCLN